LLVWHNAVIGDCSTTKPSARTPTTALLLNCNKYFNFESGRPTMAKIIMWKSNEGKKEMQDVEVERKAY
jgi:hypothetical protein